MPKTPKASGPNAAARASHGRSDANRGGSEPLRPTEGVRWRFYQLYIILALFDVGVIIAGIIVQHQTIESFNRTLKEQEILHNRQEWLNQLASDVVHLNAPGNDVFMTLDIDGEKRHFQRAKIEWKKHKEEEAHAPVPQGYTAQVENMIAREEEIFALLENNPHGNLERAATLMAEMDRSHAHALETLQTESARLLGEQKSVLEVHGAVLHDRTRLEFVFIIIVGLLLLVVTLVSRRLKLIDERYRQQQQHVEMERKNRLAAVGEVCFSVAHNIRNPLAAIASSAQLVKEYGSVDDDSRERIGDILSSCRNLTERVSQLLNFAREGGAERERVDPRDLLQQALKEVEADLKSCGIAADTRFECRGEVIAVDRHLIVQAILELIGNAKDQLPRGGRITLICHEDSAARAVEIGVMDDGPGMADEVKKRACELFYTRKPSGSGIGLASVKRAAEMHGGGVVIRDVLPHGADVRMRIPLGLPDATA